MPVCQGGGIVIPIVFHVIDHQARVPGHGPGQDGQRRQQTAGEDMLLDPVVTLAIRIVTLIRNGNGLKNGNAFGFEQPVELFKERAVVAVSHGFQHFDGDNLVKLPRHFPVVAEQDLDAVFQAGLANTLRRQLVLLFGNGNAGNAAAGLPHRLDGKATPPAADFQKMIFRLQPQFVDNSLELVQLGRVQVFSRLFEDRTGICHGIVQERLEEVIGKIVVFADVASAADQCVGPGQETHVFQKPLQQGAFKVSIVQRGPVLDKKAQHPGMSSVSHSSYMNASPSPMSAPRATREKKR